ncbi:MAG: type II toxin-antitoxin system VapC family toxin [Coriobacteriaceae bacterium]|nr:type II toxin-antitoxin system VapC family toxin [Coriobacteriaceae bacterium]
MIVLDSCALVEIARQTEDGLALKELMFRNEKAISCDLVRAELASVFRKLTRTQGLSTECAADYFRQSLQIIDDFYPIEDLQSEAFRESIRLNHSAYDMFYFVLARRTGGTLYTTDRKLMRLCLNNGVNCVTLINWDEEGLGLS